MSPKQQQQRYSHPFLLFFVLSLSLCKRVSCTDFHISSASELIAFSAEVNSGAKYIGTTVFLDNDISLPSGTFDFIGKNSYTCFSGTFDGQGYKISNLTIKSSEMYVGLFGLIEEATIKNIVMDSSCTVEATTVTSNDNTCLGVAIGLCKITCNIESVVNMADVSFTGSSSSGRSLFFGGIVGDIKPVGKDAIIRNCVNYGSVIHSGKVGGNDVAMGGIVGWTTGESTQKYIFNCLNYGTIVYNGTTSNNLHVGGIIGAAFNGATISENCVSAGTILIIKTANNKNIGGVVGKANSDTSATIEHCYWTTEFESDIACGTENFRSSDVSEVRKIAIDTAAANNLNEYARQSSWSRWLLNTNSESVAFKINDGNGFALSSQLVLLPSFTGNEDHKFSEWFEDKEWAEKFDKTSVETETTLYGKWSYTLTFNFGNGTAYSKVLYYDDTIDYPHVEREGYRFDGWSPSPDKMPAKDTTVTIQWTQVIFTIIFETNRGPYISPLSLEYNEPINKLPSPKRDEFTFAGWFTDKALTVPFGAMTMPAYDVTLYAKWDSIDSWTHLQFISSASDFKYFAKSVKHLDGYKGWTVFLTKNIDMSGTWLEPIDYFCGTFDGLGHSFSNLAVKSQKRYVGLFGMSDEGAIVKNLGLDSSCSIEYDGSSTRRRRNTKDEDTNCDGVSVGSVFGFCESRNDSTCAVESIFSEASVTFTGSTFEGLSVGGIVGTFNGSCGLRNVVYAGKIYTNRNRGGDDEEGITAIGGIAGACEGCIIERSENYGEIEVKGNSGNSDPAVVGGIVGNAENSLIEGCTSFGAGNVAGKVVTVGGITGSADERTGVTKCYWDNDAMNGDEVCGESPWATIFDCYSFSNKLLLNNGDNTPLLEVLKESDSREEWVNNKGRYKMTFITNNEKYAALSSALIRLPYFSSSNSESRLFSKWHTDSRCTNEFKVSEELTGDITLYGRWSDYAVSSYILSFDFGNGTVVNTFLNYSDTINYPAVSEREGYKFIEWSPKLKKMPANDVTITAQWVANVHILTFDFDNGTVVSKILNYGDVIRYPINMVKEGRVFDGWSYRPKTMPAHDAITKAQWRTPFVSEYVEVVLDKKNMSKNEAESLVRKYTDRSFAIVQFEEDNDNGETRAVIRFADSSAAEDFVEVARVSNDIELVVVKLTELTLSAASVGCPFIVLGLALL